jgi:hypothetical protein
VTEASEELGVDASSTIGAARFVALVEDAAAPSLELIVHLPWPGPSIDRWTLPNSRPAAWEYSHARWIDYDEARRLWDDPHSALSPPARWILGELPALLRA